MHTYGLFRFVEGIWWHRKSRKSTKKFRKRPILHHACATCSELPSYIRRPKKVISRNSMFRRKKCQKEKLPPSVTLENLFDNSTRVVFRILSRWWRVPGLYDESKIFVRIRIKITLKPVAIEIFNSFVLTTVGDDIKISVQIYSPFARKWEKNRKRPIFIIRRNMFWATIVYKYHNGRVWLKRSSSTT